MNTFLKALGAFVVLVLMVIVVGMLMAWPLMLLWNGCMVPAVEGLREVGWLQAWGILVACGLLFKNHTAGN